MKPYFLPIILTPDESFTCVEWHLHPMEIPWQYRSEFLITLIIRGRGMLCVGDNVGRFREGDLVLVGPNMPVSWWSNPDKSGLATNHISISFGKNFLGEAFFALPETAALRRLLSLAQRGLAFPRSLSKQLTPDLLRLSKLKGLPRLCLLLEILHRLASVKQPRYLASAGFAPEFNEQDAGRLAVACKYIRESYEGEVRRNHAAKLAGLSPQAFSRFFHKKMGLTFERYITEIRLGQACHLLVEEDATIAEIAFQTGFNHLSNFNRHFQKIKGMTPREYRLLHVK